MIKTIDFQTIYPIWSTLLWPNRNSPIESTSAMNYLGQYDLKNMLYTPTFIAFIENDEIVGVNSGHKCTDGGYRSRGLYVNSIYRGRGIGSLLLTETIELARKENCNYVWSYPRQSSWKTYQRAGFSLSSQWEQSETSESNAYCRIDI